MSKENYLPKGYQLKEYKIERILGAGGFGVTYLAKDINLNTEVVIKEFLPREFSQRQTGNYSIVPFSGTKKDGTYKYLLKKFINEAQILASIKHPNVVRVFSFFKANNTAYFVMDYIEGESLKEFIKRNGKLSEEQIQNIIIPVLEGLSIVHKKHYLHRDIAPDNIYLRKNAMPMLIDFGAAKNATRAESSSLAAIVKAGYSAPEQYVSTSEHSPATDLYAVGAVIYTMMSGRIPPESTQRQIALLNNERDVLIEDLDKNYKNKYSQALINTVKKAMSIKENDRFQDTISMQDSIMQEGLTPKKPKPKKIKTETVIEEESNTNLIKNSIIVVLLAIIGIFGFLYTKNNTTQDEPIVVDTKESKYTETKVKEEPKPTASTTSHIEHKVTKPKPPIAEPSPQINFDLKETLDISHDNINLVVTYPKNVKKGGQVKITASLENVGSYASRGGITLSFPQLYDISGSVISNTFGGIKKYGTHDKIWNRTAKKALFADYLMIETNDEKWKKYEHHEFTIALDVPNNIEKFKIQVRGALKNRFVPGSGKRDQQDYFCKVININVIE